MFDRSLTRYGRQSLQIVFLSVAVFASGISGAGATTATPFPESLKGIPVPTPSNLGDFVANKSMAIALGKALFWDMQVGSDGVQACASCHFQAGADPRSKNQMNPGGNRAISTTIPNPDLTYQLGGPNYQLKTDDFPFHKLADPSNANSAVLRDINDIASSQGVNLEQYLGVRPGASQDDRTLSIDPVFQVNGQTVRRVEPRNTPSVINAVFNFRNFWDGRAQFIFNGVSIFGARDTNAQVFKATPAGMSGVKVRIDNASLASQAVGPPTSSFEMSADGRTFMDIGKRLLAARPLARQKVDRTDSVLGQYVHPSALGLVANSYADAVKIAFRPEWWSGTLAVSVDTTGASSVIPMPATLAANQYTQMQANFSLFFGLAIQMYESTLISDDSPWDRQTKGAGNQLTVSQNAGAKLFFGKGKCANCHGGGEFTNASVRKVLNEPLQRMIMADGNVAVYDEGFYNTGVSLTLNDLFNGLFNGGKDPFGFPLANSAIAKQFGSTIFKQITGIDPKISVSPTERIAVNGASKTPGLHNVELTQPFFSNGGTLNLRQAIEFYNRGGNFARENRADLDPDIEPLGLSQEEITQLVDFLTSLTDERVRLQKAPFDHPQIFVPFGEIGDTAKVQVGSDGRAVDDLREIPAVGAGGVAPYAVPANFLSADSFGNAALRLQAANTGYCLETNSAPFGFLINLKPCNGSPAQSFQMVPAATGGFNLFSVAPASYARLVKPYLGSPLRFATMQLSGFAAGDYGAVWHVVDVGGGRVRIYNHGNQMCLSAPNGYLAQFGVGIQAYQETCQSLDSNPLYQEFTILR